MKMIRKSIVSLSLFSTLMCLTAFCQDPIRIMPLGDSITYGSGGAGGYRYPLYLSLTNEGYNVDYVGTQTGNSVAGLGAEVNHEGHGGWRITSPSNGLYDYIYGWFEAIEDPHVILLHIGTNDSGGFDSSLEDVDNLDALVTRMTECQPSAHIIVTTLLKRGEPNYTYITNYYNPYIYPLVTNQVAQGRNVHYLDMHAYLELSDMPDTVHPDEIGYQKMADAWFPAITNIIGTSPAANQPAPIRVNGTETSLNTIRITFNKELSEQSATNTANYAVSGGITVSNATLSVDQRAVTLTTDLLGTETTYTVTMNNIEDETTPTALQIPTDSEVQFTTTSQPVPVSAQGDNDQTHIDILFNKEMDSTTATDTGNYSIDGGLSISAASLSTDKKSVTLTTSQHTVGVLYTITMNNITDESSPTPLTIPANSQVSFTARTPRGYDVHVPESSDYTLIYEIDLPTTANYRDDDVNYTYNNSGSIDDGKFDRVAYYLELQKDNEDLQYVWVSMDTFTNKANRLGFPTVDNGAIYQLYVTNMNVICNVGGVTTGTGLAGNLEFWPYNYGTSSSAGIPGADNGQFDFGDSISYGGHHGSMQIHNYVSQQTLMAMNNWGGGGTLAIGIGNQPTGHPDWTFADNSGSYTIKTLQVLVRYNYDGDTEEPNVVAAQLSTDKRTIWVTFDEKVADSSVKGSNFTLDGGVGVIAAELRPDGKTVILSTTATTADTITSVTINGIRDIATQANVITPDTTVALTSLIPLEIINNIGTDPGEAAHGYELIYSLDVPVTSTFGSGDDHYYFNQSSLPVTCDRIAYYLELETQDGSVQYVWTSMDAFTSDPADIALPTFASGNIFQQVVTNLDVRSNVSGITEGTGMTGGNIEFWPYDYNGANGIGIPGANDGAYDFGDTRHSSGSHGSMQVHNHAAGECLLNLSNWGSNGRIISIGIGNRPGTSNIDWTHAQNAASYVKRTMHILAQTTPKAAPPLPAEVAANVPSASGYELLYTIDLPSSNCDFYDNSASYYSVNNLDTISDNFTRIAYYLELVPNTGTSTNYIWTSMDAFTSNAARIGVRPTALTSGCTSPILR